MTRTIRHSLMVVVVLALAVSSLGGASAQVGTPTTEQLYISAGCPPNAAGTCTSTRWLGTKPGDATSNFTTSITPVDEVNYRTQGTLNWRDYASDDTFSATGYPLQASKTIDAVVKLVSNGPGASVTVHARLDAVLADGTEVKFGPLEKTETLFGPASELDYSFNFDIPDTLEGKALKSATFFVAVHGINVAAGYIDQEGGSTLTIPYYEI